MLKSVGLLFTLLALARAQVAYFWEDEIKLNWPTGPPKICGKPADIVFIIDASSSIWPVDFKTQLNFIRDIVNEFNIEKDGSGARIGAIIYSSPWHTKVQFNLNANFNPEKLLNSVSKIRQPGGGTYTQMAIRIARQQMFKRENGARIGTEVPQIGIVLTDGESWWPKMTAYEAMRTRKAGIRLMAVGIGYRVKLSEIHAIASKPYSSNAFTVDGFGALKAIKEELAIKACEVKPPVHEWTNCGKDLKTDVAFVLGETTTENEESMRKALHFVKKVISKFHVGENKMKVALVPTECEAPGFHFNRYNSKMEIYDHLDNAKMTERSTAGRIKYMTDKTFSIDHGARPGARKLAFIVMNGNSKNKIASIVAAKQAKRNGVEVVVLAVGDNVRAGELYGMASSRSRVIRVPGYKRVPLKIKKLIYRLVCKGDPLLSRMLKTSPKKTSS